MLKMAFSFSCTLTFMYMYYTCVPNMLESTNTCRYIYGYVLQYIVEYEPIAVTSNFL